MRLAVYLKALACNLMVLRTRARATSLTLAVEPRNVVLGKLVDEPRKGRLVGDGIRRRNAADLSDEWVLLQGAYQGCRRGEAEDVLGYHAMPKISSRMSLTSTPRRANQCSNKRLVFKGIENALQAFDNRRGLPSLGGYGKLGVGHLEAQPSWWFKRRLGVRAPGVSVSLIRTSVLRYSSNVNCLGRINVSNPDRIWLCSVISMARRGHIANGYGHVKTDSVRLTAGYALQDNTRSPMVSPLVGLLTGEVSTASPVFFVINTKKRPNFGGSKPRWGALSADWGALSTDVRLLAYRHNITIRNLVKLTLFSDINYNPSARRFT